jgi:predicted GIY-YIG superfamily endonuclease
MNNGVANAEPDTEEKCTGIEYTMSVEKDTLIIFYKTSVNADIKKYICKNCIDTKTKKTRRLISAIKNDKNMSLKLIINPLNSRVLNLVINHPLYDDEIYYMCEEGCIINNNSIEEIDADTRNKKPLCYIYILELEQNKFYVGKSLKPLSRTGEHIASTLLNDTTCSGAAWTRMYQPVKILNVMISYDEFDEDVMTIRYMKDKGIDNVRGGSFCELNLARENVITISKMITGSDDKCYYCGECDHYINACPQKNMKRITKKHKEQVLKVKDIPKSKITKYYGASKLLQNSNIDMSNMMNKPHSQEFHYNCKFCNKIFDTFQKKTYHENMVCDKNKRVAIGKKAEANVDAILETNKHLLVTDNKSIGKSVHKKIY